MGRVTYIAVLAGLLLGGSAALAEAYWIEWDGSDWPENADGPWYRTWGTWQGDFYGSGALRTLENGVLSYDSLADSGIYDYYKIDRPGQMDPGPGEMLVMQFELAVDQVVDWTYDPTVGFQSDQSWGVGLVFGVDSVLSLYEQTIVATYAPPAPGQPAEFHAFDVRSVDLRDYTLAMDGQVTHQGVFHHSLSTSWVGWGDGVMGAASVHHWRRLAFGAVPIVPGDVNCDATVDFEDINPFVGVLAQGGGASPPPACALVNADTNGDGQVDFADINPFVELLTR
jgi:hypothetical protein